MIHFCAFSSAISITSSATVPPLPTTSPWYGNEEIRILREYLRIQTVHPNINYGRKFLVLNSLAVPDA